MKLVFTKDTEHQITVELETDGKKETFSYVNMIKSLLNEGSLEQPELVGDFPDPEQKSIKRMVEFVNKAIEEEKSKDEGEDEANGVAYGEGECNDDNEREEGMF